MILFKTVGVIIIFSVCTAAGIKLSSDLRERAKNLQLVCEAVLLLKNRINHSGLEIANILPESFEKCDFITFSNGKATVNETALKKSDIKLLNDFFKTLGTEEKSSENEKAEMYLNIFKNEKSSAETDVKSKCKIFTVSGICIGLAAAILFI